MVDNYIEIAEPSKSYGTITINKGELVYFQDVARANDYFEALLGEGDDVNLVVKFENKIIKQLSLKESLFSKRKIAYISNDMALLSSETIQSNLDLYLKSIQSEGSQLVKKLFKNFNIDVNKRIIDLNDLEVYIVRLGIGLAKEPELLILNNPYAQIQPELYQQLMDFIYELLLDYDLTCLCCLSSKYLSDKFPGRTIL